MCESLKGKATRSWAMILLGPDPKLKQGRGGSGSDVSWLFNLLTCYTADRPEVSPVEEMKRRGWEVGGGSGKGSTHLSVCEHNHSLDLGYGRLLTWSCRPRPTDCLGLS